MADFYGTASGFETYHTARGRSVAAWDDADEVNAALLVASEWLDARYRSSFGGLKVGQRAQLREWPRTGSFDTYGYSIPSDVVPTEIENATYEIAYRQLAAPGSLAVDWTPNKYKRASVDGAVSVEYASFASAWDAQTQFVIVDQILSPILTGCGAGSSPLSGAVYRA